MPSGAAGSRYRNTAPALGELRFARVGRRLVVAASSITAWRGRPVRRRARRAAPRVQGRPTLAGRPRSAAGGRLPNRPHGSRYRARLFRSTLRARIALPHHQPETRIHVESIGRSEEQPGAAGGVTVAEAGSVSARQRAGRRAPPGRDGPATARSQPTSTRARIAQPSAGHGPEPGAGGDAVISWAQGASVTPTPSRARSQVMDSATVSGDRLLRARAGPDNADLNRRAGNNDTGMPATSTEYTAAEERAYLPAPTDHASSRPDKGLWVWAAYWTRGVSRFQCRLLCENPPLPCCWPPLLPPARSAEER